MSQAAIDYASMPQQECKICHTMYQPFGRIHPARYICSEDCLRELEMLPDTISSTSYMFQRWMAEKEGVDIKDVPLLGIGRVKENSKTDKELSVKYYQFLKGLDERARPSDNVPERAPHWLEFHESYHGKLCC